MGARDLGLLVSVPYGALANRTGRGKVLMLALVGCLFSEVWIATVCKYSLSMSCLLATPRKHSHPCARLSATDSAPSHGVAVRHVPVSRRRRRNSRIDVLHHDWRCVLGRTAVSHFVVRYASVI